MDDKRSLPLTPLWLIALSAIGIGSVLAAAFFSGRGGHFTVVIPWFIPAVNSLLFLIAASVAFLAFGREIIGDPSSFWVGIGSSQFAVGMLFNTLTPALLGETSDEGVSFILDITDRKHAEEELRKARDYLEVRVQERTEELTRALEHLKAETEERICAVEELRVREQMLMQQSRLAAMGEILANISHQRRQPLNVVSLLLHPPSSSAITAQGSTWPRQRRSSAPSGACRAASASEGLASVWGRWSASSSATAAKSGLRESRGKGRRSTSRYP